jgi:hypothetical protein
MAFTFTLSGNVIWRDFNIDGQVGSGNFSPRKNDIRTWATEVQTHLNTLDDDAKLKALRAITMAANKGIVLTGPTSMTTFDLTALARTLLGRSTAQQMRETLGITQLPDPDADGLVGWDDSAGASTYFTVGQGLIFDGTVVKTIASDFVVSLLDDPNATTLRQTLGLGSAATRAVSENADFSVDGASIAPRSTTKTMVDAAIAAIPTPPTVDVVATVAALSFGAVGSYALLKPDSGSPDPGDTVAGTALRYTDVNNHASGARPSGTWRCMGKVLTSGAATLFLRIS